MILENFKKDKEIYPFYFINNLTFDIKYAKISYELLKGGIYARDSIKGIETIIRKRVT